VGWCNLDLCKNVARTPDLIQRYISDHCPPTYSVSQLTHLVSVCTRMVDSPEEQPQGDLYNETT